MSFPVNSLIVPRRTQWQPRARANGYWAVCGSDVQYWSLVMGGFSAVINRVLKISESEVLHTTVSCKLGQRPNSLLIVAKNFEKCRPPGPCSSLPVITSTKINRRVRMDGQSRLFGHASWIFETKVDLLLSTRLYVDTVRP